MWPWGSGDRGLTPRCHLHCWRSVTAASDPSDHSNATGKQIYLQNPHANFHCIIRIPRCPTNPLFYTDLLVHLGWLWVGWLLLKPPFLGVSVATVDSWRVGHFCHSHFYWSNIQFLCWQIRFCWLGGEESFDSSCQNWVKGKLGESSTFFQA